MWRRSPPDRRIAPATAGTLVIHIALGWCGAQLLQRYPPEVDTSKPAPRLSVVDVEVAPAPKAADPPPASPMQSTEPAQPLRPNVRQSVSQPRATRTAPQAQGSQAVALPTTADAPIISVPEVGVGATGVRIASGTRTTATTGGATGAGSGSDESAAAATSIATIKTRAMPRGDFAYSLVKDYPSEAKQLGIEGKIRVKLVVDERGVVAAATLLNRLGYGLDELATRRARELVFDPARDTDDKPVRSVVIWTFDFTLPK